MWDRLAAYLKGIDASLRQRPKAVLVISGHWEMPRPTVNTAPNHTLLFDYYGFPEHTYRLTYPAQNSPEVVARIEELLSRAGYRAGEDPQRGLDHGVFVPFKLIYPDADMPIIQVSLLASLDAAAHIEARPALAPLRDEGVLIVGSGMSYHNLPRHVSCRRQDMDNAVAEFDAWLTEAATDPDPERRNAKLPTGRKRRRARFCHPREEHLLPLHVAAGAAATMSAATPSATRSSARRSPVISSADMVIQSDRVFLRHSRKAGIRATVGRLPWVPAFAGTTMDF